MSAGWPLIIPAESRPCVVLGDPEATKYKICEPKSKQTALIKFSKTSICIVLKGSLVAVAVAKVETTLISKTLSILTRCC